MPKIFSLFFYYNTEIPPKSPESIAGKQLSASAVISSHSLLNKQDPVRSEFLKEALFEPLKKSSIHRRTGPRAWSSFIIFMRQSLCSIQRISGIDLIDQILLTGRQLVPVSLHSIGKRRHRMPGVQGLTAHCNNLFSS